MKRANQFRQQRRLSNGNRRRLLMKRAHQKMQLRRQQFQARELCSDLAEAC